MRISVIIPCHNAESYLAQTIGSVLDQSRPPEEIIVIDDGSTDNGPAIAASFGDRLRVFSKRREGAPKARNFGASAATGDALMFLDADDVLGPTVLENLFSALRGHPQAIALCPWYRLEYIDGRWVRQPPSCSPKRSNQDFLGAWLTGWYHPPCSVLWSRGAYESTGGWDERVLVNNDGDIMMRALVNEVPIVRTVKGAAYYRRVPNVRSVSGARLTRAGLQSRIRVMRKIARLLEERKKLHAYRAPIGEAFDRIAVECMDGYPELVAQCQAYARRYAGHSWIRKIRKAGRALAEKLTRLRRFLRCRIQGRAPRNDLAFEPPAEIRFGLEAAKRARVNLQTEDGSHAAEKAVKQKPPVVSVILPTYNRADTLPRALNSVLGQTFPNFEVLVIDDGSTDSTPDILDGYRDARIRYLRRRKNRGVGAARNLGLREARGEFVAFLDSDDEWFPDKLALQVSRFRALDEDVALIYSGVESVFDHGAKSVQEPIFAGYVYKDMLLTNVIHGGGSNVLIRRRVTRNIGYFDERMPAIEDYDYWLRITRLYKVDYVDRPLIRYHDHQSVRGFHSTARRSRDIENNLIARSWFYRKYSSEMKRFGVAHLFLLESARRHLTASYRNVGEARWLLLRAIFRQPLDRDIYPLLFRTMIPDPVKRFARKNRQPAPGS